MRSSRVFIAPSFGAGHVFPLLTLAEALATRGHDVVFYAGRSARKAALGSQLRFREQPGFELEQELGRVTRTSQAIRLFQRQLDEVAPDMARALARERPDIVVTDALHPAAALAAMAHGARWVSFASTPALLHPGRRQWAQARLDLGRLRRSFGLSTDRRDSVTQAMAADVLLLPFTSEFDLSSPPPNARHVGPLSPRPPRGRSKASSAAWISKLGKRRPAVLVGVSTLPLVDAEWTNYYVSEAVRALNRLDVDAIFTLSGDEWTLAEAPAPHLRLERFVPHEQLMPRLSAVVTHSGWGTIGRALTHGVPMLTVPQGLDQPLNARLVERAGVGLRLPLERLTWRKLLSRLTRLLAPRSSFQKNAEALARKLSELHPDQAAVDAVLGRSG